MRIERFPARSLASGQSTSFQILRFPGSKRGAPIAYLQSTIHGSEVQGILVLAKLIDHLKKHPPLGEVRVVPLANPEGLNHKIEEFTAGRFDATTGDNWNRRYFLPTQDFPWGGFCARYGDASPAAIRRAFKAQMRQRLELKAKESLPYADRQALRLQLLSIDADFCLDLHCANHSVRHLYAPAYAERDATYFGIPLQLLMPKKFGGALDEVFFVPWLELKERLGVEIAAQSFTLELGSHEEVSSEGAEADLAGILNYLRHQGVVAGKPKRHRAISCKLENYKTIYSPRGGIVEYLARPGVPVRKGQPIARILSLSGAPKILELRSPYSGIPTLHYSSAIAHEGSELFKMLTFPGKALSS